MTNQYIINNIIRTNKQKKSNRITSMPYYSWLDYKRKFHIVRYYPTQNMYIKYRYFCFANGLAPFGAEVDEDTAYYNLINHLKTTKEN